MKRVFLIVLDSAGIGFAPDADKFGDTGANTIRSCFYTGILDIPNMKSLGLFNIDRIDFGTPSENPIGAYARLCERSMGKDTTIGHWELTGVVSEKPLPVYPNGFPSDIIDNFSAKTGRKVICNTTGSGTEIIKQYGREHMETGALIVYTSADSVFQIAAHEDIIPVETLYEYCRIARSILVGEHGVGRVIARPFTGEYPGFVRTSNRHDFSLEPPKETLLDVLSGAGLDVIGFGKIYDIFAGRGITEYVRTKNNADGAEKTLEYINKDFHGLCFTNLVDFDMVYGHRRNAEGYAKALNEADAYIGRIMYSLKDGDLLMITADHGCDPKYKGSDHTRESVPLLIYGKNIIPENLGIKDSYTFAAEKISEYLL